MSRKTTVRFVWVVFAFSKHARTSDALTWQPGTPLTNPLWFGFKSSWRRRCLSRARSITLRITEKIAMGRQLEMSLFSPPLGRKTNLAMLSSGGTAPVASRISVIFLNIPMTGRRRRVRTKTPSNPGEDSILMPLSALLMSFIETTTSTFGTWWRYSSSVLALGTLKTDR